MNNTTPPITKVYLSKKIQDKVRYGLTLNTIRNRLTKIGIEITPYYLYQEGINIMEMPMIKGIAADYPCDFFGPEDMKIVGNAHPGFPEEKLLKLLNAGQKCIGIKHKGEVVAFMWINFMECSYKSTNIILKSNEAYLWFMYTKEAYRGKNLAPYLRYKSYEILKDLGRDKLYSISDYFNSPAVKFKKKLNARILRLMLFIKLFNKLHWDITLRSYCKSSL